MGRNQLVGGSAFHFPYVAHVEFKSPSNILAVLGNQPDALPIRGDSANTRPISLPGFCDDENLHGRRWVTEMERSLSSRPASSERWQAAGSRSTQKRTMRLAS